MKLLNILSKYKFSRLQKKLFAIRYSLFTVIYSLLIIPLSAQKYTLEDLNTAMYVNNPDIRAAEQEYKRAIYDYHDALAGFGPKIDFQIAGVYMVNPPVGSLSVNVDDIINSIQWPGGAAPSATGQYIKIYDGMEKTYYNFGIKLEQPIWTWGKITNAARLYKEISRIQEIKVSYTKSKLESELETRIATLKYLYQIDSILEQEKVFADELVQYSVDAEKNGMLLHQDVIEAQIKAKELDIAKQDVEEQITNQLIELQRITGIEDLSFENIEYEINDAALDEILSQKKEPLLEAALSQKQDSIRMVTQTKTVNEIASKIAKADIYYKPDIGFVMSLGYGGPRFPLFEPNWRRKDDYSLNLSVGIKTTVWDGGKKLNQIARAKSNVESAQINEDATRAVIRKTFQEQWNNADVCKMKIDYQNLKIETAESKIAHQNILYQNGAASKADLLNAKIDKCNQEIEKTKQELSRAVSALTIKFLAK